MGEVISLSPSGSLAWWLEFSVTADHAPPLRGDQDRVAPTLPLEHVVHLHPARGHREQGIEGQLQVIGTLGLMLLPTFDPNREDPGSIAIV